MKTFAGYVAWFASMAVLGLLVGMLTGCGSDYCSPFEKPDASADPVTCQQAGCAK